MSSRSGPDGSDGGSGPPSEAVLTVRGPFDLAEAATMGFGHRDERGFDGVMRLGFCLDGGFERQVGVAVRQESDQLRLEVTAAGGPLAAAELAAVRNQVARVLSVDQDGAAFDRLCRADPVLDRVHAVAPGFRPVLFYSPYEAAVWSVISARRARPQGIALRTRLAEACGVVLTVAGQPTPVVPTPSELLGLSSLRGLPADRTPRLHAVAQAAQAGRLEADRLRELPEAEAAAELQRLPGIGPFYSSLILVRACGHADLPSLGEERSRAAIGRLYGLDERPDDAALLALAEQWRPFRTWVTVMLRALGDRVPDPPGRPDARG